jgi:hypothetical protein
MSIINDTIEQESPSPEPVSVKGKSVPRSERDEKAMWYVPWSVTSFDELDGAEVAQEKAQQYSLLTNQFTQIAENILYADEEEVGDKSLALQKLADDMSVRMSAVDAKAETPKKSLIKRAMDAVFPPHEKQAQPKMGVMFTKQEDGRWRWLATYSNSFIDKENEVITANSHLRFEKMVDAGEYDYPELWLHHEEGWRFGVADFVATDVVDKDVVFAVAGGLVDEGKEWLAEQLSTLDLGVSHGMPITDIVRDSTDSSHIIQHRTVEISPLIRSMEANDLTSFIISNKESHMPVSTSKRELYTQRGLDPDALLELEQVNGQSTDKALTEGRIHKEVDVPNTEEVAEVIATPDQTPEADDAVLEAVKSMQLQVESIATSATAGFGAIVKQIEELGNRVAAIETKEADTKSLTPAASLDAVVQSVIGRAETKVDGRTKEAKLGPVETKDTTVISPTGIKYLDELKAHSQANSYVSPHVQQMLSATVTQLQSTGVMVGEEA